MTSASFTGTTGSLVVTGSADGTIRAWDAVFQPVTEELARLGAPIGSLVVRDDGRLEATTTDGRVHILDPRTGAQLSLDAGPRQARRVVGPDGSVAVIRGNTVMLRTGGRKLILSGHRNRVNAVAFSRLGGLLATASRDHDVRIWNVATGKQVARLQGANTAVHDAQFSPDGRWLIAAASKAGAVGRPRPARLVLRLAGHEGTATSVTLRSDRGDRSSRAAIDGTVRTYACRICGGIDDLLALADSRLAADAPRADLGGRARAIPPLMPRWLEPLAVVAREEPVRHSSGFGAVIANALRRSPVNQTWSISLAPCWSREPGGQTPLAGGFSPRFFPSLQTMCECQRRIGPAGVGPTSPSRVLHIAPTRTSGLPGALA